MNIKEEDNQKELWKKDAEQLKADLKGRPKEYKKNEVDIKFGGVKYKKPTNTSTNDIIKSTPEDDLAMRRFLGIS